MIDKSIKILTILENNPYRDSNAANNRFIALAEGLVNNNCELDLIFLKGFENRKEKITFKKRGIYNGLRYSYLFPYFISNDILRKLVFKIYSYFFNYRKIIKQINNNDFDYIWLGVSPRIINIGLKLFKNKYNESIKILHERSEFSWIGLTKKNKIHDSYLYSFLPKVDCLIVMTNVLKVYYKKFVSSKTQIIHLPMTVDFKRFEKVYIEKSKIRSYIAYCGTMNNTKDGVNILIESFIKIMRQFPELDLYLAGAKQPAADYQKQIEIIQKNKAEKRIIYLGNLSRDKIPSFLIKSKILAMARPKSKQAEGGFPTKLGEYLATGNPVCVTRIGEISNYLVDEKNAFIAESDSIESFSNALLRALTSEKAKQIGQAGLNIAQKNFNKDIQAKKLYQFLHKQISER